MSNSLTACTFVWAWIFLLACLYICQLVHLPACMSISPTACSSDWEWICLLVCLPAFTSAWLGNNIWAFPRWSQEQQLQWENKLAEVGMRGCVVNCQQASLILLPWSYANLQRRQEGGCAVCTSMYVLVFWPAKGESHKNHHFVLISIRAARLAVSLAAVGPIRLQSLAQGLSMRAVYNILKD